MPAIRLATQIGEQAFVMWRLLDGTLMRTPLSLAAYEFLNTPNAGPPPKPPEVPLTAEFDMAYRKFLLDTPSGEQEDGVRFGNILFYEKAPGQRPWEMGDVDLEDNGPGRPGEHTGIGANITLARPIAPGITVANGRLLRAGQP